MNIIVTYYCKNLAPTRIVDVKLQILIYFIIVWFGFMLPSAKSFYHGLRVIRTLFMVIIVNNR